MNKVTSPTTDSFREKGSKFIGYLFPIESKEAFELRLNETKSEYPDATHHCYGWRIDPSNLLEFSQDDGEPSGTAGLPILNQLKSFEVINTAIIVVRYYGGTNLGKSGLIQAYGRSAEHCLQKADLEPIHLIWEVVINYPYPMQNIIEKIMYQYNLKELDSSYRENVKLKVACPIQQKVLLEKKLSQLEHKEIKSNFLRKGFI